MGMDAEQLSEFADHPTCGLLGADVLSQFDVLIDIDQHQITFSKDELAWKVRCSPWMHSWVFRCSMPKSKAGPIGCFLILARKFRIFSIVLSCSFPPAGSLSDFYPGYGQFETETHQVEASVGGQEMLLRCGSLPKMLAAGLVMGGAKGIIGNEILPGRVTGYFPRRKQLVLAAS